MTAILYVTDLHGHTEVYEAAFRAAKKHKVDALILGGDLCPTGFLDAFIPVQREFLTSYLIPRIEAFGKDTKIPVFAMFGNDDFRVLEPLMAEAEQRGILKLTNMRAHRLGSWTIIGYSSINEAPFLMKDWEKPEAQIASDLLRLAKGHNMKKTVFHFHAPPKDTACDMLYDGSHVGSEGVRQFVEEAQPLLTLHGHIHESPEVSEHAADRIGKTICVNPGNGRLLLVELEKPEKMTIVEK